MKNFKINLIMSAAVAALLFAITYTSKAQNVEFGVRYMPTFTSLDLETTSEGTVKGEATLGHGFGAFLGFNFTEHFGIQGEVIYSSLSQKYSEQGKQYEIDLTYINVPLLLSLNSGKSKPVNLNLVAGPQIGFNVGSDVKTTSDDGTTTSTAIVSVKKSDVGFAFGAGVDFGINAAKTFRLGLGYRGVIGIIDISDNSETTTTDTYYVFERANVNTNAAYIGVSYLF
jgi:opacity protein-like surface antigen